MLPMPPQSVQLLLECLYEFNACLPYSGTSSSAQLEEQAVIVILALLPNELHPGMLCTHLSTEEAKLAVAVRPGLFQGCYFRCLKGGHGLF